MLKKALLAGMVAGLIGAATLAVPECLADDAYEIPVIVPQSGGASFVGAGQRQYLELVEAYTNRTGGIRGRPVHFTFYDDQTSPQVAVQLANQVLAANPTVVLGSSLVGMCNAMAPLMKNGPVLFCLSPGFHPQPGSYAFSSSTSSLDQVAAAIRYFREKGWTKLAILNSTDASGQDGDRAVMAALAMPENKDMQLVEKQSFNPTDVSVSAQMERIKASGATAMISWTTGAPVALVFKAMIQAGLDIPLVPTSGNQTFAQMEQYAGFLPRQFMVPSALYPEHDGLLVLDPRVEKRQHEMYAVLAEHGLKADNMVATSWDAGLIVVEGLRALGPQADAATMRAYIAGLSDFAGVDGVYDFKAHSERGLGGDSAAIMRYESEGRRWGWLSQPGGAPLAR